MIKKLFNFSLYLIIFLSLVIFYLSFFGLNTKKLNDRIQSEILNLNKKVNLELKSVRLLLDPLNFSIKFKTLEPQIFFDNKKIELEYITTIINLKTFINGQLSIDDLQISTKDIKLNDVVSLARYVKNSPQLFILDKIIKDGFLVGNIKLNFDNNGKVKDDYEIEGFVKNGKLGLFRKYEIENLNFLFKIKKDKYNFENIDTNFNEVKFSSPLINIKNENNLFKINGKITNDENDNNFDLLNNLFGESLKNLKIDNINFKSENDFSFDVNKKFKIDNFNLKSIIDLDTLNYNNTYSNLEKYFPTYKNSIKLKNNKVLINYNKDKFDIVGKGLISIEDKADEIEYEIIKKDNKYTFDTNFNLKNNSILIDSLKYKKDEGSNSSLQITGVYKKNKKISFSQISFKEKKNKFLIKELYLDSKYKILDIKSLNLNFINNDKVLNKIILKKNKKNYSISGKSFDASNLIDKALNDESKTSSSIFENLNSIFTIKIDKTYLDKDVFVNNLNGNIKFKKNKIDKLNLSSIFPNKKKLNLTINTNNKNEKITTLFSEYPKPLIKRYKFIKGFEEGILDFYSVKKEGETNSVLKIDNFKVQEVPVLAKLLSLASLQGIADLLTGEGIRFTDFEMKYSNRGNLMTIQELYGIGPAISILMEGYIDSKKLISLRGTLVPATTINRAVSSIPLIGGILVGKKVGEGVFGVSFKIKGPPGDLKTSVNPIKTLTPRFITRTLEKIKKN